jgi:hypothetical protein
LAQAVEFPIRYPSSFHPSFSALPELVQIAIDDVMEARGCTSEEALLHLVLAGQSQGGQVLNVRIAPGTTAKEVRDALNVALELAPNADMVMEREPKT